MIRISKAVLADIIEHAKFDAPIEACGYLGEKNGDIVSVHRMENTDSSGEHFSLKPEEQFAVIKDMRTKGIKPAAVYHSHPESPARPSAEDIRLAYDPGLSYVIVSLADSIDTVKSFRIRDGKADPETIEIIE